MTSTRRRRSARAGRPPMYSIGRSPVARREHRQQFWRAIAAGASSEDAGRIAGVSPAVGTRWFRQGGGMPTSKLAALSGRYLSFSEREEIALLRAKEWGVRAIARRLGRSPSTISRELRRNAATRNGGLEYRASTGRLDLMSCQPCRVVPSVGSARPVNSTSDRSHSTSARSQVQVSPCALARKIHGSRRRAAAAARRERLLKPGEEICTLPFPEARQLSHPPPHGTGSLLACGTPSSDHSGAPRWKDSRNCRCLSGIWPRISAIKASRVRTSASSVTECSIMPTRPRLNSSVNSRRTGATRLNRGRWWLMR